MGQSSETAISLAIGIQPRTAVDVFDFLRPQILDSLFWRQRLPVAGAAGDNDQLRNHYTAAFKELGEELLKMLASPRQADAFLAQLRSTESVPQSTDVVKPADPTS
jgi:hypothetical protein